MQDKQDHFVMTRSWAVAVIAYTINVCEHSAFIWIALAVFYIELKPNPNIVNHQI